jgi:hypothetical protein
MTIREAYFQNELTVSEVSIIGRLDVLEFCPLLRATQCLFTVPTRKPVRFRPDKSGMTGIYCFSQNQNITEL